VKLRRLGVARFWYEGNAFCPMPARQTDFERREWRRGPQALTATRDTATELAGVSDFLDAHPNWEARLSRCASALPSGPIEVGVFEAFLNEVIADFSAEGLDAIYLSLHGAAITEACDAPELELISALRALHPGLPIGASFDLHANQAPELANLLTVASGYRTYPHVDMRETARRTLDLLRRAVEGEICPVGVIRNEGLYLSSANMRTSDGPMQALQQHAQRLSTPPILDVSVFGGFAYANSRHIGASIMVWADGDPAAAQAAADELYADLKARRPEFDTPLVEATEGIRQALRAPGLVAVTEASDNCLSGGIGDTPGLLAALVALTPDGECVHAGLADATLVQVAWRAGVGAVLNVQLGGRLTQDYGAPVPLFVTVERLTHGRYVNTGPMEQGLEVECGPTAVLRHQSLRVIVTSHVTGCNDPAFFALHGVDLDKTRLLAVKAKNHFRAAFEGLCTAIVDVDTPGPATLRLDQLNLPSASLPAPD
jgi:microcystin degradation protein MlrC